MNGRSKLAIAVASVLASAALARVASADTTLVDFDFENAHFAGPPAGQNPTPATIVGDTGTSNANSFFTGFHANPSTIFGNASPLSAANGGGSYGASANYWTSGDYWQFNTSSTNYNLTSVSFAVNGSNTGPRDFELEYSLTNSNNASYVNIASYNVTYAAQNLSFNVSAISAIGNQSTVYFRLVNYDTVNVINNGQVVQTGGTDRIDNIIVTGIVPGAASGNLTFDPNATAGGTANNGFTPNASVLNFIDSGTGKDVSFANGNLVNFTDSGVGSVNVDPAGVSPSAVNVTNATGTYTFSGGAINGAGALTKTGAGLLVLASTNGYTGNTIISGGTVQVSADADLGAGALIQLNGGTLQTTASFSSAKNLSFTAASTIDTGVNNLTFTGTAVGTSPLTKVGSGNLTLNVSNTSIGALTVSAGAITLSTASTGVYVNIGSTGSPTSTITGSLTIGTSSSNTVEAEPSAGSTIGGTGSILVGPGSSIVEYSSGSSTISTPTIALTTTGGVTPFFGAGTGVATAGTGRVLNLTGNLVDGQAGSSGVTFGGTPGGSVMFTGKVTVSGNNTYSGGTTITAGTVVANGNSPLGTGPVTVGSFSSSAGGILAGTGTISQAVSITAGGSISAGSGGTTTDKPGTLTMQTSSGAALTSASGVYLAKLDPGDAVAAAAMTGGSSGKGTGSGANGGGATSTVNDELLLSGFSGVMSVSPVLLSTGTAGSTYSFLIASVPGVAISEFAQVVLASNAPAYYSLSEQEIAGNDDLILDVTPEPGCMSIVCGVSALSFLRRKRRVRPFLR